MTIPFLTPPAGPLHPDPVQEQARVRRLIASHQPPEAPFDGLLVPGSFHRASAGSLAPPAVPAQVKSPFTFAF